MTSLFYYVCLCGRQWREWSEWSDTIPHPHRCAECSRLVSASDRSEHQFAIRLKIMGRGHYAVIKQGGVAWTHELDRCTTFDSQAKLEASVEAMKKDGRLQSEAELVEIAFYDDAVCYSPVLDRAVWRGSYDQFGGFTLHALDRDAALPAPGGRIYLPCADCGAVCAAAKDTVSICCPPCYVGRTNHRKEKQ